MHLFITGIGGFVGHRLARQALARGLRVSGSHLEPGVEVPGATLHRVDLLDREGMCRVLGGDPPDAVVHLGGLSHVGESWQRMADYFRVNVLGTENLLAAAPAEARVVVASSSEVYGDVPEDEQPIRENRRLDPRTPYALTKASAERLALLSGAVVVRSFNLVGPGQASNFALPAFAGQLAAIARAEQAPVLRVGNLTARRDFVHVDDGAAAYLRVAEAGRPGETYNLATGLATSIEEALALLTRVSGVEARVEVDPARVRPVDLPLLCGDASHLQALGWEPRLGLEEALRDLWVAVWGEGR